MTDLSQPNYFEKLEQSFDQMRQIFDEEYNNHDEDLERADHSQRLGAMKAALETLSGICIERVTLTESDSMVIQVIVKECEVQITTDEKVKLSSIQILSDKYSWIHVDQILNDALKFPSPNDLRATLFFLHAAQSGRDLFQNDVSKLKKLCLVSIVNPFVIKFLMKNNMSFLVEGSPYYSKVLNSVKVVEVTSPNSLAPLERSAEEIKFELNNSGFLSLLEMYEFLTRRYPC